MIVGVDPGTSRVGIAIADPETRFARPLETVPAEVAVERIALLARSNAATKVVVGRPLSLTGEAGAAVRSYEGFRARLREALPADVELLESDERLTSALAERQLRSAGVSAKKARGKVDAFAAQVMLQGYLDGTRADP